MDGILLVDGVEVLVRDAEAILFCDPSYRLVVHLNGQLHRLEQTGVRLVRVSRAATHAHGIYEAKPVFTATVVQAPQAPPPPTPVETLEQP
jgi:hypothetical protein